jgi:hypothetical protein
MQDKNTLHDVGFEDRLKSGRKPYPREPATSKPPRLKRGNQLSFSSLVDRVEHSLEYTDPTPAPHPQR